MYDLDGLEGADRATFNGVGAYVWANNRQSPEWPTAADDIRTMAKDPGLHEFVVGAVPAVAANPGGHSGIGE